MNISDKKSRIFLAVVIVLSLALSTVFMMNKQGYHEDELLTYNLANSANTLKTDGNGTAVPILSTIFPYRTVTALIMNRFMKIK